jgi:hypothetical protein
MVEMPRMTVQLSDKAADGLAAIASASGRGARSVASELLERAILAKESRKTPIAERRLLRALRDLETAALGGLE